MLFGTRNKTKKINNDFKLLLDNVEINHVNSFKFLGVSIDQNLSWKIHIDNLCKNAVVVLVFYIRLTNFFLNLLF